MLTEPTLERGRLLYEQGQYEQALREFEHVLTIDPGHSEALLLQAYTLIQLNRPVEALETADTLLQQWPDQSIVLELKARVLLKLDRHKEALRYSLDAIHLDPADADYRGTAALIHYDGNNYPEALRHAEEGLNCNPAHAICLNIRNLCLVRLGRSDELVVAARSAGQDEAASAVNHASTGWALLEKGEHAKAREHFAEALRLSPGLTWAEAGMLEALKAKNPVFRVFLKYYFWMANLKGQQQWAVLIGSFLGLRLLNALDSPPPGIKLLQGAVLLLVWLTWFIDPLFNVLMLADGQGRHLLSDRKRSMYRYVAVLMPVSFTCALSGYLSPPAAGNWADLLLVGGLMGLGLVLPLSAWIEAGLERNRKRLRLAFYVMSLTALATLLALGAGNGLPVFNLFMVELVLFMFFRNYLLIEEND